MPQEFEEKVGLVRLQPEASPPDFEDSIRHKAPHLIGSLMSWVGGDWFAVPSEVVSVLEAMDGAAANAAGVNAFQRVSPDELVAITSLRDPQGGPSSFALRDRDVDALPPVAIDPPEFSWGGQYQGKPVQMDWHVASIGLPKAWEILGANGPSAYSHIKVGHIDTGYTENPALGFGSLSGSWLRPDLGKNLWKEKANAFPIAEGPDRWSATPEYDGPRDNLTGAHGGHGTRTCSVLAGLFAPAGMPISHPFFGAAPGATVIPYRIADSVIIDHVPDLLAAAIKDSVAQGAEVISISLGALRRDSRVAAAVQDAYRRGVIICAAAGQVFKSVIYPGRFNCVITVGGATTEDGRNFHPWRVAARGPTVDVCGPADHIRRPTTVISKGSTKFLISGLGMGRRLLLHCAQEWLCSGLRNGRQSWKRFMAMLVGRGLRLSDDC